MTMKQPWWRRMRGPKDEASCHVYGMPRRAAELNLLDYTGSPAVIGAALGRVFGLSALLAAADAPEGVRVAVGAARTS